MTDQDAIQQAYEATLMELYRTMFSSYALAEGNTAAQADADAAFKKGLAQARAVRDKAIALL